MKKGKRGSYKKTQELEEMLDIPDNKNMLEAQINLLRGRIRMFEATMRGLRNRMRKGLDLKIMQEYQKFNQRLYKTKKAENVLVYHKNML